MTLTKAGEIMEIFKFCHKSHIQICRVGSAHAQLPPPPGSFMLCAGLRGAGPVQTSSSYIPDACQRIGVYIYHININVFK